MMRQPAMLPRVLPVLVFLALLPAPGAWADGWAESDSPAERARQVIGDSKYQAEIPDIEQLAAEACNIPGSSASGAGPGPSESGIRRSPATSPRSPDAGGFTTVSAPAVAAVFQGLAILMLLVLVLGLLFMLFQLMDRRGASPTGGGGMARKRAKPVEVELPPIDDVEKMAAAGDYAGATHLLLQHALRLLTHRAGARLAPSQTSREVLSGLGLEAADRDRMEVLMGVVERSFFGGNALARGDYEACRSVFDLFANPQPTGGA